jgi:SAM-dependent methyltransferase
MRLHFGESRNNGASEMTNTDFKKAYSDHVADLEKRLSADEALKQAIGGEFIAVGKLEYYLLRSLGLSDGHLVIDVGCGSGRLACQLAPFEGIRYIGCDVVQTLLNYAKSLCKRDDWEFVVTDGVTIPAPNGVADYAVFFSVLTHLLHEDSFKYFREAARVLKPRGYLVASFLEFKLPMHWSIFIASVENAQPGQHLNQFVERDAIYAWAEHAGFEVESIQGGDTAHIPIPEEIVFENGTKWGNFGAFGQSLAILRKKADC